MMPYMAIHDKKEYRCNICEKTLIGEEKLQNHVQGHEIFESSKCNLTVKMNSGASRNKKKDVQAAKTFACKRCSYVVGRQNRP